MAKKRGLAGWHSMSKAELVKALVRQATRTGDQRRSRTTQETAATSTHPSQKSRAAQMRADRGSQGAALAPLKSTKGLKHPPVIKAPAVQAVAVQAPTAKPDKPAKMVRMDKPVRQASKPAKPTKPSRPRDPQIDQRIQEDRMARQRMKDLSFSPIAKNAASRGPVAETDPTSKDRLILMVRDAYWLQAYWELKPASIQRAQAALALHWHTAKPVLRVLRLERGPSNTSEQVARDMPIHGGVRNWYVHVDNPPGRYCVEVGYLAANKRFYRLVRSNVVTTPRPGSTEIIDGNWTDIAENCEKVFAMSGGYGAESNDGQLKEMLEERLRRPIGPTAHNPFGAGAMADTTKERPFAVQVDAEMIVYGITRPGAYVTMGGEPIKIRADGTFTARVDLPERRQVVPIVASSPDGTDEQTVVLAIERNTKVMETVTRHAADD